jgi:signal transduction histidine kinase
MKKLAREPKARPIDRDYALASVAHELRGHLSAIISWAQLLQGMELAADARHGVEVIHRQATIEARLVEDLVDRVHLAHGNFRLAREPLDLVELARAAVDAMRPAANERHIELRLRGDEAPGVEGDPVRLRQVIHNLLSNAIRYSPSGSHVDLEIERAEQHVVIRVRDSGIGIAPAFLPHVFERYRREGRSPAQGLGLGLAIARAIVELHGGTIIAESAGEGQGATFTVSLSAADEETPCGPTAA